MNRSHSEYAQFKREFWLWFDRLPGPKKKVFWEFKHDIAELNFYFTVWEKKHDENQIRQR